ncbi:MAG TPA: PAS domain S-box protein [Methanocella sp.]|uniref:PAS domain S-box protein n=1 Tax=Methanocella sp. TaxID=2052833 RepID=UPI002CC8F200|nr:PAS domain S-box protein [Methanocella sp.]HTY91536.1 PAS domain S-box protein [Methanocella sp.]
MEMDRNILSRIKEILKSNPRGMNVTDIVREVNMNRQSVSKYLEMLVMSGHVDVRSFGPSKVYYLSQRLPLSAMLSLSYGFIIVLDKMLNVINVNDHFLEFTGIERGDMMYKNFEKFAFTIEFDPSIMPKVKEALEGTESSSEALYKKKGVESYFNVRFIPMVMDDGEKGVAIFFEDITEKKKIENAVRDSEFKLRSIIEQMLDGVVLMDEQGSVIECNQSLENIIGIPREEVIGRPVWDTDIIYSGGNEKLKAKQKAGILDYLRTGTSALDRKVVEREILRPDGSVCIVQLALFSIKSDKGYMLSGIYKDITEGKLAERELRQSEENFHTLVESTNAGIVIYQGGKIVSANRAAERILSYSIEELYSLNSKDIFSADDLKKGLPASLMNIMDKMMTAGSRQKVNQEVTIISKSGESRQLGVDFGTIVYKDKPAIIVTFYDITPFKELESKLKRSEERYRILAEAAEDVIFIVGSDLKVKYVNSLGARLVGQTQDVLVGRGLDEVYPPEISANIKTALHQVIETKKSVVTETGVTLLDKKSWWNVKLIPIIENGAVASILGYSHDITERKRWEEELRKTRDELDVRVKDRTMELEVANMALIGEIDRRIRLNQELEESQRTLSTLIDNLPGVVYRCKNDKFWTMDFISDGCRDIMGYEPADITDNKKISYEDIVHPEDRKKIRDQIERAIEHNAQFNITYRIVTASGSIRLVNEQGRGIFLPDGELVDIEGYISDISNMVDLRTSWDRGEEKYMELVENVSDIIWETDKDLRFVYVSPQIVDILGLNPEETIGRTPYDLMPPEDAGRIRKAMTAIREKPDSFSSVIGFLRHKNGENIKVDISARPFFNDENLLQGYRGITRKLNI